MISKTSPNGSRMMSNMHFQPEQLFDLDLDQVTLLALYAHPDDETYLAGGLMAAVARAGGRVVHVTATLGELGTSEPDRWPPASMARRRKRELGRALEQLGVSETVSLGYSDGACDQVDVGRATEQLARTVEEIRPDLVVGFGPDGVTGHPDHVALARWLALATIATGNRTPLMTSAVSSIWPADIERKMRDAGAFMPDYRKPIGDNPVQLDLDDDLLARKLAALDAYASQTPALRAFLGESDFRRLAAIEAFRPANLAARQLVVGSITHVPAGAPVSDRTVSRALG
jgi:LmbE family N-acetylglucosaminyl deacetylase